MEFDASYWKSHNFKTFSSNFISLRKLPGPKHCNKNRNDDYGLEHITVFHITHTHEHILKFSCLAVVVCGCRQVPLICFSLATGS